MTPNPTPPPGAGGWVPSPLTRWLLTLGVTVAGGALPLLAADVINWKAVAVAAGTGLLSGLTAFLGISSAGPRTGAP